MSTNTTMIAVTIPWPVREGDTEDTTLDLAAIAARGFDGVTVKLVEPRYGSYGYGKRDHRHVQVTGPEVQVAMYVYARLAWFAPLASVYAVTQRAQRIMAGATRLPAPATAREPTPDPYPYVPASLARVRDQDTTRTPPPPPVHPHLRVKTFASGAEHPTINLGTVFRYVVEVLADDVPYVTGVLTRPSDTYPNGTSFAVTENAPPGHRHLWLTPGSLGRFLTIADHNADDRVSWTFIPRETNHD